MPNCLPIFLITTAAVVRQNSIASERGWERDMSELWECLDSFFFLRLRFLASVLFSFVKCLGCAVHLISPRFKKKTRKLSEWHELSFVWTTFGLSTSELHSSIRWTAKGDRISSDTAPTSTAPFVCSVQSHLHTFLRIYVFIYLFICMLSVHQVYLLGESPRLVKVTSKNKWSESEKKNLILRAKNENIYLFIYCLFYFILFIIIRFFRNVHQVFRSCSKSSYLGLLVRLTFLSK